MSDFAQLEARIAQAMGIVREVRGATPLEMVGVPGRELHLKVEAVPPIYAYKWRGAFTKMSALSEEERARGVVAASAGNHAQGVAMAAAKLGMRAKIFMPLTTPLMKQCAVRRLGGDLVEVVLLGDTFNEAAAAAAECVEMEGLVRLHPYDDLDVIAGQGTLGVEIADVLGGDAPDTVFLQIGGGGMAAGVGCWLKKIYPGVRVVGVEGENQASMKAAVEAGAPTDLSYVDVFCDGTAVSRAGDVTYPLCRDLIDEFVTVTNAEVCAAIRFLWDQKRIVTEPAGAMGVAAWMAAGDGGGARSVAVLCGANMDFQQFRTLSRQAGLAGRERRFFRFTIPEADGALHGLLTLVRERVDIVEFLYGKADREVAHPVLGIEAKSGVLTDFCLELAGAGISFEDVTGQADVEFRLIPYNTELFSLPYFVRVEFLERAGALADFMEQISRFAGICYFSYVSSGERVGRALLGFEFRDEGSRAEFLQTMADGVPGIRNVEPVPSSVVARIF